MRLLQGSEIAGGEVGGAPWRDGLDLAPQGALVGDRAAGHDGPRGVVEGYEPEPVAGVEPVDEGAQGGAGGVEALAGHRAAAVERDLQCGWQSGGGGDELWGSELGEQRQLVGLFQCHEVEVERGRQLHGWVPLEGLDGQR